MPGATQPYDERLTVPRSWWLMAIGAGVGLALVFFPFGLPAMLGGLVAGAAASMIGISSYGSARVRVVSGYLVAGKARIPLSALGGAVVLDEAEAVAWRSYKADPRAFMLLRSYVRTAVRVEVTDPADPTPYLYLSTRSPKRLAAALGAVRPAGGAAPAAPAEPKAAG
ncbi:DUF3093 domain-containing protein [Actinacidiphila guanduensis]|uniref:DUF3093 domain-containing protein n=1 Tax=Actinacidiphila guanduensis TaxID=310781 RepID=A0A1H0MB17_9ACTN|nr:DUF3093 domain-containing protein [Actinacidiphila guanduensis]SDO77678.1 Protein of unknown function [Actinacidiphila guanduensis]